MSLRIAQNGHSEEGTNDCALQLQTLTSADQTTIQTVTRPIATAWPHIERRLKLYVSYSRY